MGLIHPTDIDAWHRWQESQHRLRQLRHALRPGPAPRPERFVLTTYDAEPRLLVAVDSSSPTSHASLVEPLVHVDVPLAVLSPGPAPRLPGREARTTEDVDTGVPDVLRGVRVVASLGHHLPRGRVAHTWAGVLGATSVVVQHGALTPYAPPLPRGARLLAWSDADADFWRAGRSDVEHEVVGSQLLWAAGGGLATGAGAPSPTGGGRLTYLGQMHAAELPRARLVRAAAAFCRSHDAVYRPHPSEHDRLSRLAHTGFGRLGVTVDGSIPLSHLTGPVVSVFSTGVLEAAAQGRDAWVDFPRPAAWLGEFWERYGMHRYGAAPTPPPARSDVEPARRVAAALQEAAG